MKTFTELGVSEDVAETLASHGIITPFPIQALAIPLAMKGHDLIGQARTGTGKTMAFTLPLLHTITPGQADGKPQALVVVPTRELASQVARDVELAVGPRAMRVMVIYGGRAYEPQLEALRKGVDIVVGTPGRLLDLAKQKALDLSGIKSLVLDEADEMLDLGFLPDVERIVSLLPAARQTMLFSATMPGAVVTLARRYLRHPTHVRAESPDESAMVPLTSQFVFRAHHLDKPEVLARVMQADGRGLSMVFTRTKRSADRIAADLAERGFAAAAVHGDLGQGARERALRAFRNGKVDILVATDVAARGIDVPLVTHVINYECPDDEKTYLHRIGRTGRAGEPGVAITFVDWADGYRWGMINKALDLPFPEPEETYSTSDVLYAELDIPRTATGRLPSAQRTREGLDAEVLEDLGETGRRTPARSGARDSRPDSRGQRSHSGTRSSEPASAGDPASPRPRRQRQRTRRSGGSGAEQPATAASGTATATAPAVAASTPADATNGATPTRRRRSRRRSGGSSAESSTDA
ncbi:MAG TPA: DEAD/DEAH box helicase [Mycobacteriales bacterium]|nr:DEAD/DEAH box helicase [Mycobacteriales bacterium]